MGVNTLLPSQSFGLNTWYTMGWTRGFKFTWKGNSAYIRSHHYPEEEAVYKTLVDYKNGVNSIRLWRDHQGKIAGTVKDGYTQYDFNNHVSLLSSEKEVINAILVWLKIDSPIRLKTFLRKTLIK